MKTLLVLGYENKPIAEKIEILKNAGFVTDTIALTYKEEPDPYTVVRGHAQELKPEFIIGTSLGGYVAYWIAEELGIPCLLFNPTMETRRIGYSPYNGSLRCPMRLVVIGQKDRVVNPLFNQKFFEKKARPSCIQKTMVCSWVEHTVDNETFEEMIHWALFNLKKFKT
jgi:hypothetical protein